MPILEGIDGVQRMSKSLGNYIGISEPPRDMFGKVMSIPDTMIARYFELATDVTPAELDTVKKPGWRNPGVNPQGSEGGAGPADCGHVLR